MKRRRARSRWRGAWLPALTCLPACTSDASPSDAEPSPPGIEIPRQCGAPAPAANPGGECTGRAPTDLALTIVASGLQDPVDLESPVGDVSRLFVAERPGRVRIIENGELLSEPFLDISAQVESGYSEQGLLGIALDPGFDDNQRVWINYTGLSGQIPLTVVASVRASSGDPNRADPSSLETLFEVRQPARNHNGGALEFGPDGCLFVAFGDGGDSNDPFDNGQSPNDRMIDGDLMSGMLGSLARIDVEAFPDPAPGNTLGANAPDHPNAHVWHYGLRNAWRISFDRDTGDLYVGDVGQDHWEEVDVGPAGVGGLNFGWRQMEGRHCRGEQGDAGDCAREGLRQPAAEYFNLQEQDTPASVIGGYVYRGRDVPQLWGRYLYADYASRVVSSFVYSGEGDDGPEICDEYDLTSQLDVGDTLASFGQDARGELYVLTLGGRVLRIDSSR